MWRWRVLLNVGGLVEAQNDGDDGRCCVIEAMESVKQ